MTDTLFIHKIRPINAVQKFLSIIEDAYSNVPIYQFILRTNVHALSINVGTPFKMQQNNKRPNSNVGDLSKRKELLEFIELLTNLDYVEILFIEINAVSENSSTDIGIVFEESKGNDNKPDGLGFQIRSKNPNNHPDKDFSLGLLNSIHAHYSIVSKYEIKSDYLSKFEKDIINVRENNLIELQNATQKLITNIASQTTNWDSFIHKTAIEFQNKFDEREKNLSEKFKDKEDSLESEKEEFYAEKKQFEDRARTHVRRDLLEKIKAILKENQTISLSEDTVKKRQIISKTCFWIIFVSAFVVLLSIFSFIGAFFIKNQIQLFLLLPGTVSSALLVSTVVYFLSWNNRWLQQHVDAEFFNKKFETDILRANWIIEMFFEWQDEKGSVFPEQLINSFTKNLFDSYCSEKQLEHPLEQIFKSTGKFKKIRVGKNMLELEKQTKQGMACDGN